MIEPLLEDMEFSLNWTGSAASLKPSSLSRVVSVDRLRLAKLPRSGRRKPQKAPLDVRPVASGRQMLGRHFDELCRLRMALLVYGVKPE